MLRGNVGKLALSTSARMSTLRCSAPVQKLGRGAKVATRRHPSFVNGGRRDYASSETGGSGGSSTGLIVGALAVAALGGAYYYGAFDSFKTAPATEGERGPRVTHETKVQEPVTAIGDYQAVYKAIADVLEGEGSEEYDDGSYGPVIVRLAWHASGTYDKETQTGGSNGATMRFAPEGDHGANAGLKVARDALEPVKAKFPWITYSDLWTLAGVCAIQEMHGPLIPWRPGRQDKDIAACTPDGRLPDASKDQRHLRDIFNRMGWNDQEIVALSGAHALGRCHTDRSGFSGPWTFSPTTFSNEYYKLLMNEKWQWKKWNGPKQLEDKSTKTLMMLPTDMALIKDGTFRKWVETYAKDENKFFEDFSNVFSRLLELGVPFPETSKPMTFTPTYEESA